MTAVAAFDFDRTLTTRDTFGRFLRELAGSRALVQAGGNELVSLGRAVAHGGAWRDEAKERLFARVAAGVAEPEAAAAAERVVAHVRRHLLRAPLVHRLRWHVGSGHRVVVVSASFHAYVSPVVRAFGASDVLATRWEVDAGSGLLTGRFAGANVRGPRKAEVLQRLLGVDRIAFAYGDSRGDREMLAMAHEPCWVGGRGAAVGLGAAGA